jgi:hypothetical protein
MFKQLSLIVALDSLIRLFVLAQEWQETDKKKHTNMHPIKTDSSMNDMNH